MRGIRATSSPQHRGKCALNVKRLIDDKPILSEALAAKKIAAVGGIYDIATGKVN